MEEDFARAPSSDTNRQTDRQTESGVSKKIITIYVSREGDKNNRIESKQKSKEKKAQSGLEIFFNWI